MFNKNNLFITQRLKEEKIFRWQVAKKLGIHETKLCRLFREPLTDNQVQQILNAVEEIKSERKQKE